MSIAVILEVCGGYHNFKTNDEAATWATIREILKRRDILYGIGGALREILHSRINYTSFLLRNEYYYVTRDSLRRGPF